jgi:hypothetical protein
VQNIAYASAAYLQEIREQFIRVSDDEVNTVLKEESIYHDEKIIITLTFQHQATE